MIPVADSRFFVHTGSTVNTKKRGSFRNNLFLYREAWALDKGRVIGECWMSLTGYLMWIFGSVVFTKYLLWCLEQKRPAREAFTFLAVAALIECAIGASRMWFSKWYKPLSGNRMVTKFSRRLFDHARAADLSSYEDADFYNSYTLAVKEAGTRMESVVRNVPEIAAAALSAVSVTTAMGSIDPWVIAFIAFPIIGNFFFGKRLNALLFERDKKVESHRRKVSYADRVHYMGEYAKELRLSNIGSVLRSSFDSGVAGMLASFDEYGPRARRENFAQNMLCYVFNFEGLFLYGTWLAMVKKSISLSDFAVLASGVVSASWMIINLSNSVLELMKNGTYIENLRSFLDAEISIKDAPDATDLSGPFETLEFRDVSFAYRGQDRKAVEHLSFTLRKGEKVALVGVNGAGKSTFVKLVTRLYDPTSGEILYNGKPIRGLRLAAYRSLFVTAFQDFRVFSLSVAENVLGRARGSDGTAEGDADRALVEGALADAGVLDRVRALPNGIDTVLTREFDESGAVLSGGESQKIAVARAFAGDFEIALFDEPSSALDPIAEYGLYESMMRRCRDRTVVFISHRLSSATLADRILVMDGGRIVEEGSHARLMEHGGAYAKMFAMQAERYIVDNYATFAEETV